MKKPKSYDNVEGVALEYSEAPGTLKILLNHGGYDRSGNCNIDIIFCNPPTDNSGEKKPIIITMSQNMADYFNEQTMSFEKTEKEIFGKN